MAICKKCDGKGAVKSVSPSKKDRPCFRFASDARTCPQCYWTGEDS